MPKAKSESPMLTAGAIAEQLGVTPAKVKKAIEAAGIKPAAKKGACCYYAPDTVKKIKAGLI